MKNHVYKKWVFNINFDYFSVILGWKTLIIPLFLPTPSHSAVHDFPVM